MKSVATRRNSKLRMGHFSINDHIALGCTTCAFHSECGGFSADGIEYDCRSLCRCKSPDSCTHAVCPEKQSDFARRYDEVRGFDLHDIQIQRTIAPVFPNYIPVIDGPASRSDLLAYSAAVVPITKGMMADRFVNRLDLTNHFLIQPDAKIILGGVGQDQKIEPHWTWITSERFQLSMKALQPDAVWTPNFSAFTDTPRTNDLHSMKRIAICAERIAACGVAPILHLNGRTPHDYSRWSKLLASSPIEYVAYEFHSMRMDRKKFHCEELCLLASRCNRPLTLLVRGALWALPLLTNAFSKIIVVDTVALQVARRRYYQLDSGSRLDREPGYSLKGETLDRFAQRNIDVSAAFYARHTMATHPQKSKRTGIPLPVISRT